jgi:hypothetical protein
MVGARSPEHVNTTSVAQCLGVNQKALRTCHDVEKDNQDSIVHRPTCAAEMGVCVHSAMQSSGRAGGHAHLNSWMRCFGSLMNAASNDRRL